MDDETITIRATMRSRWVPHFLGMLAMMQSLGNEGCSRKVSIYSDGDGDFRPRFDWDVILDPAEPVSEYHFDAG